MLTITKLGIATARDYFHKEFANVSNSYSLSKAPFAAAGAASWRRISGSRELSPKMPTCG